MKTLFLTRHAKSSWKNPDLSDIDRPLNRRGKKNAPLMGTVLKEKEILPDLMLTSPAKRAKKTALFIAEAIGYSKQDIKVEENIYEASPAELMDIIHQFKDKYDSVMMFGHNPSFTTLNNYLSNNYIDNIPTCGISAIQFDTNWSNIEAMSGKSVFFIYPKLYT